MTVREVLRLPRMKIKFLIVIEKTKTGFSAYSPDLPGCVATGPTRQLVEKAMQSAIQFHLEGMRAEGLRVPAQRSYSTYVEVPA
jgi:predicted RNase H-like HicB family nuclease